jgi:predicted DNA-binding transcriptional regulator AlpA
MEKGGTAAAKIVLLKQETADLIQVSARHLENYVRAGKFPRPFYVGDRSPRWLREDVLQWLREQSAAAGRGAAADG